MKIRNNLTLIILLVFVACKNHTGIIDSSAKPNKESLTEISADKNLSFLDTIIFLSGTKDSYKTSRTLSEKEAQTVLYKYFAKKGIKTRNELKDTSYSKETLCVEYDTIYRVQTNRFSGAIISYWLGPTDLNERCFRPTAAIILNTKAGRKITNEEFIPSNYAIDSVIKSTIYGYDYECGGRGVIRYLKVTLK
jgi:hypothetical protein